MATTRTSWKSGQSGNPNGRPRKGKTMTDELQCLLRRKVWPFNKTCRELIALRLVALGLQGEIKAIQYIYDRTDGKPAQALEVSGDQARPLSIKVITGDEEA